MKKRIFSMLIALVMVLGLVPVLPAVATEQSSSAAAVVVTTFDDLVNQIGVEGAYVKLGANIVLASSLSFSANVTLDLAGYTISADDTYGGADCFYIEEGVQVIFTDSSEEKTGKILSAHNGDSVFWLTEANSHLTLENVSIQATGTLNWASVYSDSTKFVLKNCSIDTVYACSGSSFELGENVNVGSWSMEAGAIFNTDPSGFNGFDSDAYEAVKNEETGAWTLQEKQTEDPSVIIAWADTDGDGVIDQDENTYSSLVNAFEAETFIKLCDHVSDFSYTITNETVTLDLNGKTVTLNGWFDTSEDATLTIEDSSEEKSGRIVCDEDEYCYMDVYSGGKLILNGGTVEVLRVNAENSGISVNANVAKVIVCFGTVTLGEDANVALWNITGGTFAKDPTAFVGFDSDTYEAVKGEETGAWTVQRKNPSSEATVDVNLILKPVDADGNVIDATEEGLGELDVRLNGNLWVDSVNNDLFTVNIGENTLSDWDLCPDGYVVPDFDVTFTADEKGNITITSGNATLETVDGINYIVVKLKSSVITGASLSLSEDLTLKYYVECAISTEEGQRFAMQFTMNGKTVTVTEYTVVDNEYVFAFTGIAPNRMTDLIDASFVILDEDGNVLETLDEENGFSVKAYAEKFLNDSAYDSALELRQLLVDMLTYGAAAQEYTDYNTDTLANQDLSSATAPSENLPGAEDAKKLTVHVESLGSVYFTAATVWFDNVNRIGVKLSTVENAKLLVDGEEVTLTGTTYYTDPIPATEFGTVYTFALYEGDTLVETLEYSVNAYAYSMQSAGNEVMKRLANALYRYGLSAVAYAETLSPGDNTGGGDGVMIPEGAVKITDQNAEIYTDGESTSIYDAETGWTGVLTSDSHYSYFTMELIAGTTVYYRLSGASNYIAVEDLESGELYSDFTEGGTIFSEGEITVDSAGSYTFQVNHNVTAQVWIVDHIG